MITKIVRATLLGFLILVTPVFAADNLGYDPQADPFERYHEAILLAKQQDKLVLVIAGGDWCHWCHVLDRFVAADAEVDRRLHEAFIVLKVYVGFDNYNETFFSQLPPAKGAPHFWIISPEKEVLTSLSTGGFEAGKGTYAKEVFLSFIDEWKQHTRIAAARHSLMKLNKEGG